MLETCLRLWLLPLVLRGPLGAATWRTPATACGRQSARGCQGQTRPACGGGNMASLRGSWQPAASDACLKGVLLLLLTKGDMSRNVARASSRATAASSGVMSAGRVIWRAMSSRGFAAAGSGCAMLNSPAVATDRPASRPSRRVVVTEALFCCCCFCVPCLGCWGLCTAAEKGW